MKCKPYLFLGVFGVFFMFVNNINFILILVKIIISFPHKRRNDDENRSGKLDV
jgi:hypothetical protein